MNEVAVGADGNFLGKLAASRKIAGDKLKIGRCTFQMFATRDMRIKNHNRFLVFFWGSPVGAARRVARAFEGF